MLGTGEKGVIAITAPGWYFDRCRHASSFPKRTVYAWYNDGEKWHLAGKNSSILKQLSKDKGWSEASILNSKKGFAVYSHFKKNNGRSLGDYYEFTFDKTLKKYRLIKREYSDMGKPLSGQVLRQGLSKYDLYMQGVKKYGKKNISRMEVHSVSLNYERGEGKLNEQHFAQKFKPTVYFRVPTKPINLDDLTYTPIMSLPYVARMEITKTPERIVKKNAMTSLVSSSKDGAEAAEILMRSIKSMQSWHYPRPDQKSLFQKAENKLRKIAQQRGLKVADIRLNPDDRLSQDNEHHFHLENRASVIRVYNSFLKDSKKKADAFVYEMINSLLQELDKESYFIDPEEYGLLMSSDRAKATIGAKLDSRSGSPVVIGFDDHSTARSAGLKVGDVLIKVDGKPTKGISPTHVYYKIQGEAGSHVSLLVKRNGTAEMLHFNVKRSLVDSESISHQFFGNICYIKFRRFDAKPAEKISAILTSKPAIRGLILDLRDNEGGMINQGVNVSNLFVDDGVILSMKGATGKGRPFRANSTSITAGYPVVVLTNRVTAGASEIIADAISTHAAGITLGEKTFGRASIQSVIPLPMGVGMRLTSGSFIVSSGADIEGKGLIPDIEFRSRGNASSGDPLLSIARQLLQETSANNAVDGVNHILNLAKQMHPKEATLKVHRKIPVSKPKKIVATPPRILPSFDCTKAMSKIEKAICMSNQLSGLDAKMAKSYQAIHTSVNADTQTFLKSQQKAWLTQRNQCIDHQGQADKACLAQKYERQLERLQRQSSGLHEKPYRGFIAPRIDNPVGRNLYDIMWNHHKLYPDGYAEFSNGLLMVRVDAMARLERGLYVVNPATRASEKILAGDVEILDRGTGWWLVHAHDIHWDTGMWDQYLLLKKSDDGKGVMGIADEELLYTAQDGESGLCRNQEFAKKRGWNTSQDVVDVQIKRAGTAHLIRFNVIVQNCRTLTKSKKTIRYAVQGSQLKRL